MSQPWHSSQQRPGRYRPDNLVQQRLTLWGAIGAGVVLVAAAFAVWHSGAPRTGTTDPEPKVRLERLFEMYKSYVQQHKKAPPDEAALKLFIQNLSADEKKARSTAENVDELFISPSDHLKYVIRYGVIPNPGGATEAMMWEQTGQGGQRYVVLSVGYVQRCSEEDFREIKKK